jgi:Cu-Zn family superoxide dismutase
MFMSFILALVIVVGLAPASFAAGQQKRASAKAELKDRNGRPVGTVVLIDTPHGVLLHIDASGLPPGEHGFHIHETGRCEPPDFKSAGGHFAPAGRKHGFYSKQGHHAGDMANLVVAEDGKAKAEIFVDRVQTAGGKSALLRPGGTAIVIHANPDDYQTDPAGDAGDRIACGVVERQ